jgi:DNA invertase Pin-like site-specific DNA recombinase
MPRKTVIGRAAMVIGYVRTSTADQNAGLAAHERDLKGAGCTRLFSEHISSPARRDKLKGLREFTGEGDAIVVTKPDRLARSTREQLPLRRARERLV